MSCFLSSAYCLGLPSVLLFCLKSRIGDAQAIPRGEGSPSEGSCRAWHACVLSLFSRVQLCATPWTAACQDPLSVGFSRQEYWNGRWLLLNLLPTLPPFLPSKKFDFSLANGNRECLGIIFACSQLLTFHQSCKLTISQFYPFFQLPTATPLTIHQHLPQNDSNTHPVYLLPLIYSIWISLYLYSFLFKKSRCSSINMKG